jgi:predicted dehydrogenase
VAGGALMDIGCYCVSFPRFLFNSEPFRVISCIERDPLWKTDRLTSAMLDFGNGQTSMFTCSTQLMPYQRVHILGTNGHIEIEIPVNAPKDSPCKIWVRTKTGSEEILVEAVDQYTLQAEQFAQSILDDKPVPTNLMDAVNNMKVIEAIFESAKLNGWKEIG